MSTVKNEHLLLRTLIIGKSLAMEGVSFLLDKIFTEWIAAVLSVTLLSAVAEIIPQVLCSRYVLTVGANLSVFVRLLLLAFFPISYPFSKLLDWLLGKGHAALLERAELKSLVNLHANEAGKGGQLSHHETTIRAGALDLTEKTAKDAMTPVTLHFPILKHTMGMIMRKGHSHIPIYSRKQTNIIGPILVKNLIFCHPEDETPIKYMTIRRFPRVTEDWPLYDILNEFQKGQSHMPVVVKSKKDIATAANNAVGRPPRLDERNKSNPNPTDCQGFCSVFDHGDYLSTSIDASNPYSVETEYYSATLKNIIKQEEDFNQQCRTPQQPDENTASDNFECLPNNLDEEVIGIITLEDVMEELLQEDILDETDQYVDVHHKIRINLQHSRRASSGSFRRASTSRHHWRTSDPSPLL
ncbi:DUF21 domain-containing protein [Quillaja saponaria]|uniref:DUF21 domain-containing protein n=1 Tax=Quillaja saponaria TaxID=32244 RepID=A0AAD7M542_QUISA|nr:DUF21 domain-containing protein [Quillaja saponaria]